MTIDGRQEEALAANSHETLERLRERFAPLVRRSSPSGTGGSDVDREGRSLG